MTTSSRRARLREKAANGDSRAFVDLSHDLHEQRPIRLRESALWCRKAAELGDPWAQGWLGHCHDLGLGVRRDAARAMSWWRRALRSFASMRARVSRSPAYRRASARDRRSIEEILRGAMSTVMSSMGDCLLGEGVRRNRRQAVRWLRKAAELGDRASTISLSDLIIFEDLKCAIVIEAVLC